MVATPARSRKAAMVAVTILASFGFAAVKLPCCGANICGIKYSCSGCQRVVDEACMPLVESAVQFFTCSCGACANEVPCHTIKCHGCHFRVHAACTTHGIFIRCAERGHASPAGVALKACKFNHAWLLTGPWLEYNAVVRAHAVQDLSCASKTWELRAFHTRNFQLQIIHHQGS